MRFTAGYARCGRSGSVGQVPRGGAPGCVPKLPILQFCFVLPLRSLRCRCQPQLSCGGKSLVVPQLPILQPLRASRPIAGPSFPEVSCWGQRGSLSQLPLLPLARLKQCNSFLDRQKDNTPLKCVNISNTSERWLPEGTYGNDGRKFRSTLPCMENYVLS
jgi:hypothetical protein